MKQTNSAIKFLMAQYRAIFKNANLKMFLAATAAATAMLSTQAVAGNHLDPTPSFETELADSTISEGETLTHNAAGAVVLKAPEGKPVVINGGKLALGNQATHHIFTANDIILNKGSIDLQGTTTQKDFIPGLEGKDKDIDGKNTPETASLTVNGGELNIKSSFVQMKNVNLAGGVTTASGQTGKKYDQSQPITGFKAYSNIYAWGGAVTVSNDAVVNLNEASGINSDLVKITGGTVNLNGKTDANGNAGAYIRAGNPVFDSEISVTGGTVNVAAGMSGGMHATAINMNGGKIDVAGTLTIGTNIGCLADAKCNISNISVTGGKFNNAATGTVIIDGNAEFADGTLNNQGTLKFKDIPEGETRSLTIGANDFNNNFLKAADAKLTVSGTTSQPTNGKEYFDINVTGDTTVDLVGSGFLKDTGALNDAKVDFETANIVSSISAKNATIGAAAYSAPTVLEVESLTAGKSGAFSIDAGANVVVGQNLTVTPKDTTSDLTVKGSLTLDGNGGSVNANKIILDAANSSLAVTDGKWTAKDLTITSGAASVSGEDTALNLTGMLTTTANGTLKIQDGATVNASAGDLNLVADKVALTAGSTLTLDSADVFKLENGSASLVTPSGDTVKSTFVQNAVTTDATSILKLKYNGEVSIADLSAIKTAIATDANFKGFLKLEGASIKDRPTEDTNLADVKAGFDGLYNNVAIKVAGGTVNKSFTAAQVQLTDAQATAAIAAGNGVMLTGAKGDFVVKSGGGVADVSLDNGSSLVLAGNGSIGAITGTGANSGSVVIGHSSLGHGTVNAKSIGGNNAVSSLAVLDSNLNVDGAVKTGSLDLAGGSSLKITANAGSGSITTKSLDVSETSSINAAGQAITVGDATDNNNVAEIYGNVTAASLTIEGSGSHTIAGNATVTLDELNLGTGANASKLAIGVDESDVNGSATLITKKLTGTGTIAVDPAYGQKAALVIAESLSAPSNPQSNDAGTLSGTAIVGNNAALAIGFSSEAELNAVIGQFLDANGSFSEETKDGQLANALVLNKKITIDSGHGILVEKNANIGSTVTPTTLTLGAGTGLIITDKAFGEGKQDAAITINHATGGASGSVVGNGGKILLSGKFDETDELQIFKATNLKISAPGGAIEVESLNGLLSGQIQPGPANPGPAPSGKAQLELQEEKAKALFAGVSAPAQELLIDTLKGEYKTKKGVGTDFVYTVANTSMNAVELDAVLHAATYAGAQQAAVAAVGTMAEAVAGRVGSTGVETTVLAATGAEGHGGVWVTPMYKSVNSDGFNAQGASYGSDVDLAGVTFGVDSVRGNMRFGAAFNIGSGDADGKGNGNGLKDEFDYYGFGIYTAMNFNHCSLIADASVNVISHDVEGYSGHQEFGTLGASADTTAVTMGVTGQYTHATEFVDVTPHVGMRFTRLDTDSYDLNSAKGVLANTDFDVQNVFSIPVGVTLSKTFEHNGWAYSPAADFTLTFNTGDTEVDSTTHMNDMTNVALNTEVLDEVTYGLNLGFSAQNGSFGTSVNVSYAGSENSDSVGINANARYMF